MADMTQLAFFSRKTEAVLQVLMLLRWMSSLVLFLCTIYITEIKYCQLFPEKIVQFDVLYSLSPPSHTLLRSLPPVYIDPKYLSYAHI
jgi:hypothetical protein